MTSLDEDTARRTAIEFCVQGGMTPTQTYTQFQKTERYRSVSKQLVYKWHGRFTKGVTDIAPRGRPPCKNDGQIRAVQDVIDSDRRKTVRDVAESAGCSKSTAQRVLTKELRMSHVSARWVPRLLTVEEKLTRVRTSRGFLARCRRDPTFLSRIITTDETWVHYYEPEDKRMSMVWKRHDEPPPKKAKVVKSMDKVMCIVFMDNSGIILVHMVKAGATVNAAYYSKVVRRDLLHALRKKRRHLADNLENVVLHQDNAPSHTAVHTQLEIDVLGFQRVEHPPYSPDLAPLDFAYFPKLKSHLRGNHFQDRDEIRFAIRNFNRGIDSQWYRGVYDKWVKRHQKCITCAGEYFEKE